MTVRDWLKGLGLLTAGHANVKETQARASAYASLLSREFKPGAFTTDSLTAVARDCTFFPSFGELCKALSAWWEDNRPYEPTVPLLTGPKPNIPKPRDPPTEAELAAISGIVRAWQMERPIYLRSGQLPAEEVRPRPLALSPERLLATYERLAAQGDTAAALRVAMLRKSLAEPTPKPEGAPP
jgi:hypothetical protein